jgi:hypothetical protein
VPVFEDVPRHSPYTVDGSLVVVYTNPKLESPNPTSREQANRPKAILSLPWPIC